MAKSATYSGISADTYNKLKKQLSGFGIDMQGNTGKITEKGVSAEYVFDEQNQTLAINNVDVSFPASMMFSSDKIIEKISEAVKAAGGQKQA